MLDEVVFEIRSSTKKTLELRDPRGRIDSETVHEIPECDRGHGQTYGGRPVWTEDQLLLVRVCNPAQGVYVLTATTAVPNGFTLLASAWVRGQSCELATQPYQTVEVGDHTWRVRFQHAETGECHLEVVP